MFIYRFQIRTAYHSYNGELQIRMITGMKYTVKEEEGDNIIGKDHIVQIMEISDAVAVVDDGVQEIVKPVIAIALTAEGKIRALTETCQYADFFEFETLRRLVPMEEHVKGQQK